MKDISRGLISIDFWNYSKYPQLFTVPPEGPIVGVVPGGTEYLLRVTSSGSVKQLRWHDSILVYYQPFQELRGLFGKIRSIIESKPKYKNLPPSQVKYVDYSPRRFRTIARRRVYSSLPVPRLWRGKSLREIATELGIGKD